MPQTKEYQQAWKKANKEKTIAYSRKHMLYKKYKLTLEEYEALWNHQDGLCYICRLPERVNDRTGVTRNYLSVDHNHLDGKVRALLCHHCNAALGHVNDDPNLLRKMADYLEGNYGINY